MKTHKFIDRTIATIVVVLVVLSAIIALTACQAENPTPPVTIIRIPVEVTPVTPVTPVMPNLTKDEWVTPKRKLGDGRVVPAPYGYTEMCKRDPENVLCP